MPSQYNPDRHHRRSIRLKGYDYTTAGAYFITICTHQRQCLFGEVIDGEMQLNQLGEWVRSIWMNLPSHFQSMELDEFVVMPNHVHGIIWLGSVNCRGEAFAPEISARLRDCHANASPLRVDGTQPGSMGAIVQNFKSVSTRKINQINKSSGRTVWQRNYYEHIIRNDRALHHIRQYMQNNPLSWQQDQLHPGSNLEQGIGNRFHNSKKP